MPCISTVTQTKMLDAARLAEAMRALGHGVQRAANDEVRSNVMVFSRRALTEGFSTTTLDTQALKAVQRKYAELSLRAWSKRTGYSVTAVDGNTYTMVNRRVR